MVSSDWNNHTNTGRTFQRGVLMSIEAEVFVKVFHPEEKTMWTISHEIPDYEHDGDYVYELARVKKLLTKEVDVSNLKFRLEEEYPDCDYDEDGGEPLGYIIISGEESVIPRKKISELVSDY